MALIDLQAHIKDSNAHHKDLRDGGKLRADLDFNFHSADNVSLFKGKYYLYSEVTQSLSGGTDIGSLTFNTMNVSREILRLIDDRIQHRSNFRANLFDSTNTNYFKSIVTTGSASTKSINDGQLTITNSTGADSEEHFLVRGTGQHPFQFIKLDVESISGTSGSRNVMICIDKDVNNYIVIVVNKVQSRVEVYEMFGGTGAATTIEAAIPTPPYELGVLMAGNDIAIFTRENNKDWHFVGTHSWTEIDLLDPAVRDDWDIGFGYRLADTNSCTFNNFTIYQFTPLGMRDPTVITWKDGAPLIQNGRIFLGVTLAGWSIRTSCQGIISFNPRSYDICLESLLFRENSNGKTRPDHASHIFFDQDAEKWYVFWSTWGAQRLGDNTYCTVEYSEARENLLTGIHYLLSSSCSLPGTGTVHVYDPFVIYDDSVEKWRIAYIKGIGTVAVAESTGDFTSWSAVASSSLATEAEGTKIVKVNGTYYVVSNNSDNFGYWDYPNLTSVSNITINVKTGHRHPHPMIIPYYRQGETRYLLVSMDRARAYSKDFSWGALWFYEADSQATGYEFPLRKLLSL
ncbi:MAG: hypothetical protein DRP74_00530 [Candidatus Omnitrophota bacterium]|nr:MAG: hypothetical protein DRP74_00530 [Candidatus Omnitrophota bacterium]